MPVTMPVLSPTLTFGLVEDHAPPGVGWVSVVDMLVHTIGAPPIAAGTGLTVNMVVV